MRRLLIALFALSTWLPLARAQFAGVVTISNLSTPGGVVLADVLLSTTGALSANTGYCYTISATNGQGETLASPQVCKTTSSNGATNHAMLVSWASVAGATGYRTYGRSTGAEQFCRALDATQTSWTDDGSCTPSGAPPAFNSSGALLLPGNAPMFPLPIATPTSACTGIGVGTCDPVSGFAQPWAGIIRILPSGSPAALGTLTLTFGSTPVSKATVVCNFILRNFTGTWDPRASVRISGGTTTTAIVNWDNNSVTLGAGTPYDVVYQCNGI